MTHLIVPITQKLVMFVLIILSCSLAFPCFELSFDLLIALVVLLTFVIVFVFILGLLMFFVSRALLFVHIEQVFVSQCVTSLVSFKTIKSCSELLKLYFVTCRFHVRMVDFSEL